MTTYTYDGAGRQTGVSYSDGTPSLSLSYNFLGQQTSITDAAGTRTLTYDATHRLANETNPVIVGGMQTYTYDTYGRRQGMSLGNGANTFAQANYTYDPMGRVSTVGNGADTLTYTYVPGTRMIGSAAWTNATLNTAYTYDSYKRLTGIAVNNTPVYGYTLNDRNQRTGATLSNGDSWAYGYDELGQVTLAAKRDAQNTPLSDLTYWYDQIGNRTAMMQDTITTNYASNLLNQYTQIAAELPTYDTDGNMLTHAGWTYTYNGENRLITASNGTTRLEFDYDYMGRRIFKKVFTNNTLTSHRKFAYDGYKLIAEFDALNSDTKLASYFWQPTGLDVPLLRNEEYLIADGNKNIISVRTSTGAEIAAYAYDPFGNGTATGTSDNPFQFSSEYHDEETGLVYYNYRYYSPVLGRWINRDPVEERGGVNLYVMCQNNSTGKLESLGFSMLPGISETQFWELYRQEDNKSEFLLSIARQYMDTEGYLIFERWLLGKGDWENAPLGEYLKNNDTLRGIVLTKVQTILDDYNDKSSGTYRVAHSSSAELDANGYRTGYDMLHGTNQKVGGFEIFGQITKNGKKCALGDLNYRWNDIIDPNFSYGKDLVLGLILMIVYSPEDYIIRIQYSSVFEARQTETGVWIPDDYPGSKIKK